MKKFKGFTKLLIAVLAICFLFAGCGSKNDDVTAETLEFGLTQEDESISLVIIVGNHANSRSITKAMFEKYKPLIERAYLLTEENGTHYARSQLKVMVADGNPEFETELGNFNQDTLKGSKNVDNRDYNINLNNNKLYEYLSSDSLRAKEEQVDLAKAMQEAAIYLNNTESKKYLLILDTLVPSTGIINFNQLDFQNSSAQEVLEKLRKDKAGFLPDLTGINVIVDNVLNICEPQTDRIRTDEAANKIIDFWKGFFGDSLVEDFKIAAKDGVELRYIEDDEKSYPYVTPIAVAPPVEITRIDLTSTEVRFNPYSDEFVDEDTSVKYICDTAEATLKAIIKEDPGRTIYVVGSVARLSRTDNQKTSRYSEIRAKRVAEILIEECEIPAKNIKAIDAGMLNLPWKQGNEFDKTSESEIKAAQAASRMVAIVCGDEESDDYKGVIAALGNGAQEIPLS